MTSTRAQQVLYESEAALRLVDQELSGLHDIRDVVGPVTPDAIAALLTNVEHANARIVGALAQLREWRATSPTAALEQIQVTHDKILAVSSATEDAAINILDACDRASRMVDALDALDSEAPADRAQAAAIRAGLRDEIDLMMGALQFQDITAQQLAHASSVLGEMEARLLEVVRLFDPALDETVARAMSASPDQRTFDPQATVRDAEGRQALADYVFLSVKAPAA